MNQHEFTHQETREHLSFFYDTRSRNIGQIQDFLASSNIGKLLESIEERAYIVLGGDGLFVHIAKEAHQDNVAILGINFGTKGFLLHDRDVFDNKKLSFSKQEYPILHADVRIGDEHIHGHAFNEVYVLRAGDTSTIRLSVTHHNEIVFDPFIGDGIMLATPAGSTGWSDKYDGQIIAHHEQKNALTPIGADKKKYQPMRLPDKGRIRIKNDITRESYIDILVDNQRIVSMESRPFELTIERATRGVQLLIEQSYRERWDKKIYEEQGL